MLERVRTFVRIAALYGLGAGGVVFAALAAFQLQFRPMTLRGFLLFATFGCLILGAAPVLYVGPKAHDVDRVRGGEAAPDATVVSDGSANPLARFKIALPFLTAGGYAIAAFLVLGAT